MKEEDYREFIDSLNEWIYEIDKDGFFSFISLGVYNLIGYSPDELLGKTLSDLIVLPEQRKQFDLKFMSNLGKRESFHMSDVVIQYKNGKRVNIEILANPYFSEDGAFLGFRGVIRDITEKNEIEKKLKQSEERFRILHEASSGGIGIHDHGIIIEANEGLSQLTGFSYNELIGMDVQKLFEQKDRALVRTKISTGDENPYDVNGLKKDGTVYPLEMMGRQIPFQDKTIRVAEFRDITERKKYEETLLNKNEELEAAMEELEAINDEVQEAHERIATSEEKYRNIIDNSNELIIILDRSGILFLNNSVEKITGYRREEFKQKGFLSIVHPDDLQKVLDNHMARLKGDDVPESYEIRIFHRDKSIRWLLLNASIIEWDGNNATLVFISDLTERKNTETQLEKTKLMLEAVIEQSPAGILFADHPNMIIRIANNAMLDLLNEERDLVGENLMVMLEKKTWSEYSGDDIPVKDEENPIISVLSGKELVNLEVCIKRIDGTERIQLVNGKAVYNKKREMIGGLIFNLDITKRKIAEDELKRVLNLFQAVIEEAPFALAVAEREGSSWRISKYNREAEKINGKPLGKMFINEKTKMSKLLNSEKSIVNFKDNPVTRAILNGEVIKDEEIIVVQDDGNEVWINVSAAPIFSDEGKIFAAVVSFPDVTGMKKMEYKLKIQNDELIAMNQELIAAIEEYEAINEELISSQSELEASESRYKELNEELEKRVHDRTAELERSMNILRDAQHKLVQSEKMASLGELVAGIAHEINTPIGVSVTAASFLVEKIHEFEKRYKEDILRRSDIEIFIGSSIDSTSALTLNLERAVELIQSFKQVSVDQSSEKRRKFKLHKYIDEILLSLHSRYKRTGHVIEVDCPDDIELDSFPGVFFQIISNLVMNSLIHGFDKIEAGKIMLKAERVNSSLILVYSDNGKGMSEKDLKRIFDPFYTTRRGKGGSGLGMHIVYNLVTQKLKGTILCESRPGQGTRFEIVIPVNHPEFGRI